MAVSLLEIAISKDSLVRWNDTRTHEEVLQVFDSAIAMASKLSAGV
jgi:hypothetical protein